MAQQSTLVWLYRFTESLLLEFALSMSLKKSKVEGKLTDETPLSSD